MIEGNLVRLRPLDPSDVERFLVWMNDGEVRRYLDARYPVSRPAEEEFVHRAATATPPPEWSLAIDTLDGRHIGAIGLHRISFEDGKATLGVSIGDRDCWDRGFGTDAVRALLRFAFEEMNLNRIDLEVDARNARAIAAYRKCGFGEEARLREDRFRNGAYHDTLVMAVLAPEHRAAAGPDSGET